MLWTWTLLLAGCDFRPRGTVEPPLRHRPSLTDWEGAGFVITTATGRGTEPAARPSAAVIAAPRGRTALLHRSFVVPAGVGARAVSAAAVVRPADCPPGPDLDIVLEAAGPAFTCRGCCATASVTSPHPCSCR